MRSTALSVETLWPSPSREKSPPPGEDPGVARIAGTPYQIPKRIAESRPGGERSIPRPTHPAEGATRLPAGPSPLPLSRSGEGNARAARPGIAGIAGTPYQIPKRIAESRPDGERSIPRPTHPADDLMAALLPRGRRARLRAKTRGWREAPDEGSRRGRDSAAGKTLTPASLPNGRGEPRQSISRYAGSVKNSSNAGASDISSNSFVASAKRPLS